MHERDELKEELNALMVLFSSTYDELKGNKSIPFELMNKLQVFRNRMSRYIEKTTKTGIELEDIGIGLYPIVAFLGDIVESLHQIDDVPKGYILNLDIIRDAFEDIAEDLDPQEE